MALKFGTHQIHENERLTPAVTRQTPEFITPSLLPNYVVLLLNITTNSVYWFFISYYDRAKEVIPYQAPVDPGRYTFIVYDAKYTKLPLEIMEEEFMKHHKTNQFGKQVFKISFNVEAYNPEEYSAMEGADAPLALPDISRLIGSELKEREIEALCDADTRLRNAVCNNLGFWQQLGLRRLSSDIELLPNSIDEIRYDLQLLELLSLDANKMTLMDASIKGMDKYMMYVNNLRHLINYDIAMKKLLPKIDQETKSMFLFFMAVKNDNLEVIMSIWESMADNYKIQQLLNTSESMDNETLDTILNSIVKRSDKTFNQQLFAAIFKEAVFDRANHRNHQEDHKYIIDYIMARQPQYYTKANIINILQAYDSANRP